jgi:hypothetical protein
VELDPAEQVARQLFIERVAGAVDFSIHELSSGYEYLGDPEDDLRQLREAEEMLEGIKYVERRNHYTQELSCLREVIEGYVEYRESGPLEPFVRWAEARGRRVKC